MGANRSAVDVVMPALGHRLGESDGHAQRWSVGYEGFSLVRQWSSLPRAQHDQLALRQPGDRQVRGAPTCTIGDDKHVKRAGTAEPQDILSFFKAFASRTLVLPRLTARMPEVLPSRDGRLLRGIRDNKDIEVHAPLSFKTQAGDPRSQSELLARGRFCWSRRERYLAQTRRGLYRPGRHQG